MLISSDHEKSENHTQKYGNLTCARGDLFIYELNN